MSSSVISASSLSPEDVLPVLASLTSRGFPRLPIAACEVLGVEALVADMSDGDMDGFAARLVSYESACVLVDSSLDGPCRAVVFAYGLGFVVSYRSGEDLDEVPFLEKMTGCASLPSWNSLRGAAARDFAAEYLMPSREVARLMAVGYSVWQMADYFFVPVATMTARVLLLP